MALHRGPGLLSTALVFFIATSALITPLAGLLAERFHLLPVAALGGALTVAALLAAVRAGRRKTPVSCPAS